MAESLAERESAFAAKLSLSTAGLAEIQKTRLRFADHMLAGGMVAPVLASFIQWIADGARKQEALPLGVMREGRLLCRLMKELHGIDAVEADFNRHFGMLAAYDCGDDDALVNWLARTRIKPLRHRELEKLMPAYKAASQSADTIMDAAEAQKLVFEWRKMDEASPVHALAKSAHEKVWQHWKKLVAGHKGRPVILMDFACAGNIQRSLQTLLDHHQDKTKLIGLNFVTTKGTIWAKQKGCDIHGFLAGNGKPEWMAEAYGRSPEVIEIFAAAPLGPLVDYRDDGSPIRAACLYDKKQEAQIWEWQQHIVTAAKFWQQEMGEKLTPDLCRIIWGRLLLEPTRDEVMTLADWPLDAGLEGSTPRPFAPRLDGNPKDWTKMQTGWPAASLLRQHENF